jgi:hypothetical protein
LIGEASADTIKATARTTGHQHGSRFHRSVTRSSGAAFQIRELSCIDFISLQRNHATICQGFKPHAIDETEAKRVARLDQSSLLKFNQRAAQVVEIERKPFGNDSAVERVSDNGWVSTFILVEL